MKQEEDKKIANLTHEELKTWAEMDQEEDDQFAKEAAGGTPSSKGSQIPVLVEAANTKPAVPPPISAKPTNLPSSVRTAKAERRMREILTNEVGPCFLSKFSFNSIKFLSQGLLNEATAVFKDLSPAEQRQKQAEMRAAWRQARLKSLEQVGQTIF